MDTKTVIITSETVKTSADIQKILDQNRSAETEIAFREGEYYLDAGLRLGKEHNGMRLRGGKGTSDWRQAPAWVDGSGGRPHRSGSQGCSSGVQSERERDSLHRRDSISGIQPSGGSLAFPAFYQRRAPESDPLSQGRWIPEDFRRGGSRA